MTYNLDTNDSDMVTAFKGLGCKVVDNAMVKRREPGQLDKWVGFPNPFGGWGIWLWVEIKYDTNKPTPEQAHEIRECQDKGLPVAVVYDTGDVERLYKTVITYMGNRHG